jgi:hypothetical protein
MNDFNEERPSKKDKKEESKLSFTTWFSLKLKKHQKLRSAHYEPVLAYFKANKLTENETASAFDAALKKFGF